MEDLEWPQGKTNMGGLVGDVYAVPVEDIDETQLPTLDADGVSLTGDFVLKTDKKFSRIYHTKGTGKLDDNSVGERDGKSFENMAEFFFPGQEKVVAKWKKDYANTPMVVIVRETSGGMRAIGVCDLGGSISLDLPAYIESLAGTTGAASADRRGTTFQVKAEAPHPPLYYSGAIDLTSPDA
jgi:hypothetical protein